MAPVRRRRSPALVGCGTLMILVIVIAIILAVFTAMSANRPASTDLDYSSASEITRSTRDREKLSGTTWSNDCYTDQLGWISNSATLTDGLRTFYNETGVLPYLYLTDNVNDDYMPTVAEATALAETLYDQLFSDEDHFLLVFVESTDLERSGENFVAGYEIGHRARTVMDDEAVSILADYIKAYYYTDGLTDEQYFAKAFSEAGTSMMTVYQSPWVKVAIIFIVAAGAIIVLAIARSIYKRKTEREKEKAEETERILNTPLEKYGAGEDDLAAKYDTTRANAAGAGAASAGASRVAAEAQAQTASAARAAQQAVKTAPPQAAEPMDAAEAAAARYAQGAQAQAQAGAQAAASAVDEAEALAAKYNTSRAAEAGASAAAAAADSIAESAVQELSNAAEEAASEAEGDA